MLTSSSTLDPAKSAERTTRSQQRAAREVMLQAKSLNWAAFDAALTVWKKAYASSSPSVRTRSLERAFSTLCTLNEDDSPKNDSTLRERMVNRLLELGADPNRPMSIVELRGVVPMDSVSLSQEWPLVELLIQFGFDPYRRDPHGMSLMDRALHGQNSQGAHRLLDMGLDLGQLVAPGSLVYQTLHAPRYWSDEDRARFVQRLITMGQPIDPPNGPDPSLAPACYHGHLACLDVLLAAGADVQVRFSSEMEIRIDEVSESSFWQDEGWTLLHLAASNGQEAMVDRLLNEGLAVDTPSTLLQLTPLHVAALNGHVPTVERLLDAGASLGALDHQGRTPLDLAHMRSDTYAALAYLEHLEITQLANTILPKQDVRSRRRI